MSKVAEELRIPASLAETWELYFDPSRWADWVDEFRAVDSLGGGYPEVGGTLVWHSGPAGRGQVTETVLEHEHRRLHRIRYSDPSSKGEQASRFRIEGEGTVVRIELEYSLVKGGVLSSLTDVLFIRSQMKGMLGRTLEGLRAEAPAQRTAP